jgi:sulfur relay protein TusB/DsrH
MAALHLVNRADALPACLAVAAPDDAILLLEDGVYAATPAQAPDRTVHVLDVDVHARGLDTRLATHATRVSDADFVALVVDHQPVVTWR